MLGGDETDAGLKVGESPGSIKTLQAASVCNSLSSTDGVVKILSGLYIAHSDLFDCVGISMHL